jgi:pimeloyl-ACP methyl ester carboxylesterase
MRTVTSTLPAGSPDAQATPERPLLHEVTGRGDPLVLMPGTLTGWASWVAPAERLAANHRVVRAQARVIELVEAGMPIPSSYDIPMEREALRATVDALGLDRFDLAGWSLGGGVSLSFALAYPERVRTLTLIEPAALWLLRATGYDATTLDAAEAGDRALAGKEITIDDLKAFLVYAGLGQPGTEGTHFEAHPRWPIMVRNRQAISTLYAEWDERESIERLRSLDVPILAVKGTETSELLGAIVDGLVAMAPRVTLLELPGGHACHLEQMDRFLDAMEAHLTRTS